MRERYKTSKITYILHAITFQNCITVIVCLCERYMLKIQYLLQVYNKKIVKTNQGNKMMAK